jgi:hypothetical protein
VEELHITSVAVANVKSNGHVCVLIEHVSF